MVEAAPAVSEGAGPTAVETPCVCADMSGTVPGWVRASTAFRRWFNAAFCTAVPEGKGCISNAAFIFWPFSAYKRPSSTSIWSISVALFPLENRLIIKRTACNASWPRSVKSYRDTIPPDTSTASHPAGRGKAQRGRTSAHQLFRVGSSTVLSRFQLQKIARKTLFPGDFSFYI